MQQGLKCRQHDHEQRGIFLPGEQFELEDQAVAEVSFEAGSAQLSVRSGRVIEGEAQRLGACQLAAPIFEIGVHGAAA